MHATPSYAAKIDGRSPYERMRANKQNLADLQEKYRPETNRFNVYLYDKAKDERPSPQRGASNAHKYPALGNFANLI